MYDFNINLYGRMQVTVVAENREEAERILNDTIESITVKDIRDKISKNQDVEIKNSQVTTDIKEKNKERDNEPK